MELTKAKALLRYFIHGCPLPIKDAEHSLMFLQIAELCRIGDGMTNEEIDKLACEFLRERELGVYFYPPPPITCQEDIDEQDEFLYYSGK